MNKPVRRPAAPLQQSQDAKRRPGQITIIEVTRKRGWIRATWRWYWHCPNNTKVFIAKTMLTLIGAAIGADSTAMASELASDVTAIGILDNVLIPFELSAEVLLALAVALQIFIARKTIGRYRYLDK